MSINKHDIIKFRRGTAAEWAASEPQPGGEILRLGEPGYEKDTGKLKIGDGVTPWNSLPYLQVENNQDVILQPEDVQDVIGAGGFLVSGTGINIAYDDENNNLTISTNGLQPAGNYRRIENITLGFNVPAPITAEKNTDYYLNNNNLEGPYVKGTFVINDPPTGSPSSVGDSYIVYKPSFTMHNVEVGGVVYPNSSASPFYIYRHLSVDGTTRSWKTSLFSLDGHTHNSAEIIDFNDAVIGNINTELVSGDNIVFVYDNLNNDLTISTSGVSLEGHTHSSSDIIDFNTSVSGLLPAINNSGDHRVLTSDGTSTGIQAESNLIFENGALKVVDGFGEFGEGPYNVFVGFDNMGSELGMSTIIDEPGHPSYIACYISYDNSFRYGGDSVLNPAIVISSGLNVGIRTSTPEYTLDVNGSGNFASGLFVNNIPVSVSGHTHTSANITDFNTSVSGLIPVKDIVNGSGTTVTNSSGIYSINVDPSGISGEFDKISFSTTADPTIETAEIGWDAAEGTLDLGLEGGAKIHVGEHTYFRIRNNTGSILRAGQAVYASDVHNNSLIEASLYTADGSIREIRFIGLVLTDIDINQKGYAINFGHIEQVDTRGNGTINGAQNLYAADEPAWVEGDILYVHPTIPGKLTKVEPKHSISAAIVLYVSQNQGRIFVRPTSYGHLNDNHDVDLAELQNNNFLVYNSGTVNWEPTNNFTYNEETATTTIQSENVNNNLQLSQSSEVSGGQSPRLTFIRNRGTLDTPLPINSGDFIGNIHFRTLDSTDANDIAAQISAYTSKGLSSYDKVPTQLRIMNRTTDGSYSFIYVLDDGTFNPTSGAIINDQAKNTTFSATGRDAALQVFNSATLNDKENSTGGLHWSYGIIDPTSSANTVLGSTVVASISVPSGINNTGALVGNLVYALRNALEDSDNGSLNQVIGQRTVYGHSVLGDATTTSTVFAQGISISPFAGKGTITTAYDLLLANTIYDAVIDASGTIKEGDGSISNRYGIVQQSADPNIFNGSVQVNDGLSAPTKIYALGTVSGNVSISYDIDKQIQTLTLNGTATNFIEGSSWPSLDSVDVLLEITVSSTTSVTWSIVDDWYNPVPSFVPGKYLVLLRSIGTTIQGHYIGAKTN